MAQHQAALVFFSAFSGHIVQLIATNSLRAPAIQSGVCILFVVSEMKPPATAPPSIPKNAKIRRFLLTFCVSGAKSAGSVAISCNMLVTTTVGTSANFSARLPTICPALWKDKSAMGKSSLQMMSSVIVRKLPFTFPDWTMPATAKIMSD